MAWCRPQVAISDEPAPHDFIWCHQLDDLKALYNFQHRTFKATDTLYTSSTFYGMVVSNVTRCKRHQGMSPLDTSTESSLINFHHFFFSLNDYPERTYKHINGFKERQGADVGWWQT
jgi:hypothetical protein